MSYTYIFDLQKLTLFEYSVLIVAGESSAALSVTMHIMIKYCTSHNLEETGVGALFESMADFVDQLKNTVESLFSSNDSSAPSFAVEESILDYLKLLEEKDDGPSNS